MALVTVTVLLFMHFNPHVEVATKGNTMNKKYKGYTIEDMRGEVAYSNGWTNGVRRTEKCQWWVLFDNNYHNFKTIRLAKKTIDRVLKAA